MKIRFNFFFVLFILCTLSSCSSLGALKFWEDDSEIELPSELFDFQESVELDLKWTSSLGGGMSLGRNVPFIYEDNIYYLSPEGDLSVLALETGKKRWSKETGDMVSGAVTVGYKRIFYGTLKGELVALNLETGNEIWRSQITSEVLSPPVTDGNIVAAQTADGKISGFDIKTGKQKWFHQATIPKLTLRGTASPIIEIGYIFTGFANGKIAMIYPDSGAIRFEIPITINEGKSELERIVDIDGKSVVSNNILVSASYQGNISAIDLRKGRPAWQEKVSTTKDLAVARSRIAVVGEKDSIIGFGLSTGAILWEQNGLMLRSLSSPVSVRNNFILGDLEGFVHVIDSKNGFFVGRKKVSKNEISEIVVKGKNILILDSEGKLILLSIS